MSDQETVKEQPAEKVFRSKMFTLPKPVLDDVDRLIAQGLKGQAIKNWIASHCKELPIVPDKKTIEKYIAWRRVKLKLKVDSSIRIQKEMERTDTELRQMLQRLQVAELDTTDRKGVLEKLAQFLLVRVDTISQHQNNVMDPKFEQVITNQMAEIHSITQTLLKLEGKLGVQEVAARRIVEKFLEELAPIIKKAAEDTFGPDKMKAFLERLYKGYKSMDYQRIRDEAWIEAAALEKEENNVGVQAPRINPI